MQTMLLSFSRDATGWRRSNRVACSMGRSVKTIRAMADGSLDSQVGARICNGLGIMRACLETATLERLEGRLDQLEGGKRHAAHRPRCPHLIPQLNFLSRGPV
jgi:hypothetical protein